MQGQQLQIEQIATATNEKSATSEIISSTVSTSKKLNQISRALEQ